MIKWYKPSLYVEGHRHSSLSVLVGMRSLDFEWSADGLQVVEAPGGSSVEYADRERVFLVKGMILPWSNLIKGDSLICVNDKIVSLCKVSESSDWGEWQSFIAHGMTVGMALFDLHLSEIYLLSHMTVENFRMFKDRCFEYIDHRKLIPHEAALEYRRRVDEYRLIISRDIVSMNKPLTQMSVYESTLLKEAICCLHDYFSNEIIAQ